MELEISQTTIKSRVFCGDLIFLWLFFIALHVTLKICQSNLEIVATLFVRSIDLHIDPSKYIQSHKAMKDLLARS